MGRGFGLKVSLLVAALCLGGGRESPAGEPTPLKIKADKEILVAKDINPLDEFVWCRGSDILAYQTYYGLFYYDTKTGKTTFVAHEGNSPHQCTPDGEWLVYGEQEIEGPYILSRYEFKTGKRQKFQLREDGSRIAYDEKPSPVTGKTKVYFDGDSPDVLNLIDPKWEVVWLDRQLTGVWFSDGSALIDYNRAPEKDLIVEVYKPERKTIEIDCSVQYQQAINYQILSIDKRNRLYLRIAGMGKDDRIDRCEVDIEGAKLSCETVFDGNGQYDDLAFLFDMETMIFTRSGDTCVRAMRLGDGIDTARCLTTEEHKVGHMIALSPDLRRIAFQVRRNDNEGSFEGIDLYIVELTNE